MANRIGARKRADIPAEHLEQFNTGTMETLTLAETLAVDFSKLMAVVLPRAAERAADELRPEVGIVERMRLAGQIVAESAGAQKMRELSRHTSDIVRGWCAFATAVKATGPIRRRLPKIIDLARDQNSGVREWAWLAMRGHIAADLHPALEFLEGWAMSPDQYLRRFASESTRPRGVWCAHIEELKRRPTPGLLVLEPLMNEPERYVQDSVANWLNDASKTRPEWTQGVCDRWLRLSPTLQTLRIYKRAVRTIRAKR